MVLFQSTTTPSQRSSTGQTGSSPPGQKVRHHVTVCSDACLTCAIASTSDEFNRGFAVFDKDQTGYIGVGELRYVLTNLGEKLTDQEVDELLAGVKVGGDGSIDYRAFVREVSWLALLHTHVLDDDEALTDGLNRS